MHPQRNPHYPTVSPWRAARRQLSFAQAMVQLVAWAASGLALGAVALALWGLAHGHG